MNGIILAGGTGTRLSPLTKITNKHLLPIYNKQMIFYPLQTMIDSGIKNVTIVGGKGHIGQFLELLSSGYDMGINISYVMQEKPLGVAHGIWVALREIGKKNVFVLLGDNIFDQNFKEDINSFKSGAKVFLKEVSNPRKYGVAQVDNGKIVNIIEKPSKPVSKLAVVGAYLYDERATEIIEKIPLSERGEVEVTALNNVYREMGELQYGFIDGYWRDVGTFEGIFEACLHTRKKEGKK